MIPRIFNDSVISHDLMMYMLLLLFLSSVHAVVCFSFTFFLLSEATSSSFQIEGVADVRY